MLESRNNLKKIIAQVIMLSNILTAAINRILAGFIPDLEQPTGWLWPLHFDSSDQAHHDYVLEYELR